MKQITISLKEHYPFLQGGTLEGLTMSNPWDNGSAYKRPALIVVPGGAYYMTSRREGAPIASAFYAQGFQVFVLWYMTAPDGVRYPEQLLELSSAVDYVKKHADGLQITVVEPIAERRDDYAAITFTPKASVANWTEWADPNGKLEGITYFISNLSASELTLCFEIDEFDPDQNVAEDGRGERWSVGLGGRILLYDTVKNQQSLVHSNPMVTVPAGFQGWVRIPTSCFTKAAWCTWGNSVFDKTRIAQFTIAAYGLINMGNTFVLGKVGLYYNETVVESIFGDNGNSVADNLQLQR